MLSSISPLLLPALGVGLIYFCLWAALRLTQHQDEPPVALDSIPFIEPIVQLLRYRFRLWTYVRDNIHQPIYTLRMPGTRCYIINDSTLINAVDRQSRILSFAPIEARATAGVLGTTEETNKIMRHDPTGVHGHFHTFHKAVRPNLGPGAGLDGMVEKAVDMIESRLGKIQQERTPQVAGFFSWVRHEVLLATTAGEYGPGNPFLNPTFEKNWFEFLPGVPVLASGIFPSLLARKSLQAREYLASCFDTYFRQGHHLKGSAALQARMQHGIETGLCDYDRARGEVGSSMALVNNTVPSAFWLLHHIYSNPTLLVECRQELANAVVTVDDTPRVDLATVMTKSPLLNSALMEVFRYYGIGTILIREVVEDHKLNNAYLLKKGSFVLMPNVTQHFSPTSWGPDVHEFNAKRFLQPDGRSMKRSDSAAMRVFGGGALLCPGRHYANNVILAFVANMLLRFDVLPTENMAHRSDHKGGSDWGSLKTENSFGLGVAKVFLLPERDPGVQIRVRI